MPTLWARLGGVTVSDAMVLPSRPSSAAHIDALEVIARRKVAGDHLGAGHHRVGTRRRGAFEEYYRDRDLPGPGRRSRRAASWLVAVPGRGDAEGSRAREHLASRRIDASFALAHRLPSLALPIVAAMRAISRWKGRSFS